jgi:cysteine-rich repeat protein
MSPYLLALGAALLLAAQPVGATIADDICFFTDDPCVLPQGETFVVDDNSVLDFGTRAFVLPGGSGTKLDIQSGTVRIIAGSLRINPGSAIVGNGGTLEVETLGPIEVLASGVSDARIDLSDPVSPGAIALSTTAGGDVVVQGVVASKGTALESGLGLIDIASSGAIIVEGEISGHGGGAGDGGDLLLNALQDVNVSGVIDASGGEGGSIDISGETITTVQGGPFSRLDGRAFAGAGFGGAIDLFAFGPVSLTSPLQVQGEPSIDLGGDGGDVTVTAGQDLLIGGPVTLFGTVPDGFGGTADFIAGGSILQTGTIDATGKRTFGAGGSITFFAKHSLTLGSIATGGLCDSCIGGEVEATAWCDLAVPSGRTIGAEGLGGRVALVAGGAITVGATIVAGDDLSIRYRPDSPVPNLTGAVLSPSPAVVASDSVIQCGGPPLPNCGNLLLEPGEECDDGNLLDCDGCTPACLSEECGNGRIDCRPAVDVDEGCDDGNTIGCDGCAANCARREGVCGDGLSECGEQCDDGNVASCDETGCSGSCRTETCGNGRVECTEECDTGGASVTCDGSCVRLPPPGCGNGVKTSDEACDDNNTADCDGCSSFCEVESCGNGVVQCLEECDDFGTDPCDGCSPLCKLETCGNGVVDCSEECDEGVNNGEPGSTCLAIVCVTGTLCTDEGTGPCIPCEAATDCDPLGVCGGRDCVVGVCESVTTDCNDSNPCTSDACDPADGCAHALLDPTQVAECDDGDLCTTPVCDATAGCVQEPAEEFSSVRCRLGTVDLLLADDSVSEKARTSLGKLLEKTNGQIDKAEAITGPAKKVVKTLKKARKKVTSLRKKAEKLTGGQLSDLTVARAIVSAADDAGRRLEALMASIGQTG